MSEESGDDKPEKQVRYGPYHRLSSPTQTEDDALKQRASGELWGRTPWRGNWPQVQAFDGPLPTDANGIEFYTTRPPDGPNSRPWISWSGSPLRSDVTNRDDFAIIDCEIVRIFYGRDI